MGVKIQQHKGTDKINTRKYIKCHKSSILNKKLYTNSMSRNDLVFKQIN